jgi:hypothetical protein
MKLCALSVDLDEIPCYHAIHGLPMPADDSAHAVYARAVPRLPRAPRRARRALHLLRHRPRPRPRRRPRRRARPRRAGHELANHTHNHRYDLVRSSAPTPCARGARRQRRDRGGPRACARWASARRATPSPTRSSTCSPAEGVTYDSSVFPCPAYWAAKTARSGSSGAGPPPLHRRHARGARSRPPTRTSRSRPYWRRAAARRLARRAPHRRHPRRAPPLHRHVTLMLASAPTASRLLTAADGGAPAGQPRAARHRPARRRRRPRRAARRTSPTCGSRSRARPPTLRRWWATSRRGLQFVTLRDAARAYLEGMR